MRNHYLRPLLLALFLLALPLLSQPSQGQGKKGPPEGPPAVAIADKLDETPHVTQHTVQIDGKPMNYTATAAHMPIKNANGETEAYIFYMAYTRAGVEDKSKRPLTFAFNGGPGSASIWVHMGGMGPRRAKLLDSGDMPPPPFKFVDNESTWLDQTDLVFIDPVGTGYSRARSEAVARRLNGVQGDLESVGEFIRMYLTRNQRWVSPLFIAGESYGTFRAAGLAGRLIDKGIAFNGIALISTVLEFGTLRPGNSSAKDLSHALHLPTYTADAWYHKKLPPDLQKDLKIALKESETFAMGGYLDALNKGDSLTAAERQDALDKLVRFTGLDRYYLDHCDLRFGVPQFTRQLLRDKHLTIGRLDGRLTGPSPRNAGETAEFDPSHTLIAPPFQAAFLNYLQSELDFKTDMPYFLSGGIAPWDYGNANAFAETASALRNAFAKNPHMKVMVCQGYYDLATPYLAAQYTFNHMGISPEMHKGVSWRYYEAGHMMYIETQSRAQFKRDMAEFIRNSVPK